MTTLLPLLTVASECSLLLLECEPEAAGQMASEWAESGLVVRVVRGRKMRTLQSFFDEFAAAFQFPSYFGENTDAFDECIADFAWLPATSGYVILVQDAGEVLSEADTQALDWLTDSLKHACMQWARPVEQGEWWDRPAVPFHVVLQATSKDADTVATRWTRAGANVREFEAKPHTFGA